MSEFNARRAKRRNGANENSVSEAKARTSQEWGHLGVVRPVARRRWSKAWEGARPKVQVDSESGRNSLGDDRPSDQFGDDAPQSPGAHVPTICRGRIHSLPAPCLERFHGRNYRPTDRLSSHSRTRRYGHERDRKGGAAVPLGWKSVSVVGERSRASPLVTKRHLQTLRSQMD